jgi:PEGA domain
MRGHRLCVAATFAAAFVVVNGNARAQTNDAGMERARQAYVRGVELSKDEHWGDALAQFEDAAAARDAPLTRFNIGYCQRALGRYVAAHKTLVAVLANPVGLDPAQLEDAKSYTIEFERVIARVDVTLDPDTAAVAIDGRPLEADGTSATTFLAGVAPAAAAKPIGVGRFTVLLDPGRHVVLASRPGHQDVVVQASYRPGERATLALHLDMLPATVHVDTDPRQALVRLDGHEVGVAPLDLQRPAGAYKLEVVHDGFETYTTALKLVPGQRVDLTPKLSIYRTPLTKRWWFWTGAAVVLLGGALAAYLIVRANEPPPPYDAGSTNWLAHGQTLSF